MKPARFFKIVTVAAAISLCWSAGHAEGPDQAPDSPTSLGQPALSHFQRTFVDRLSPHLPSYFIYGTKSPEVKFQFSVKYRLLSMPGPVHLHNLNVGYTQRSLWDVQAPSSPFFDTSYMPELFWESLAPAESLTGSGAHWLGYHTGIQHESNGRDGPESRSVNTAYVRPIFNVGNMDSWNVVFAPRLFGYLSKENDNADIAVYRGYAEWIAILGKNDNVSLALIGRTGSHFDRGSLETNLSYPIRNRRWDLATFLYVQWFEGYGESILNYNRRSSIVRAGIALVR